MTRAAPHYSADDLVRLSNAPRGRLFETPEHYWRAIGATLWASLGASASAAALWPPALFLTGGFAVGAFALFCVATARRDFLAARFVNQLTANLQEPTPSQQEHAHDGE